MQLAVFSALKVKRENSRITDVSMAATAILSMISYCFSGQYRIAGKKDHNEPLVIDSLIVAEASFKKSPVMKLISQPYQEFVREYNEKNKEMILENKAKKKVLTQLTVLRYQHRRSQEATAILFRNTVSIRTGSILLMQR